MKYVAGFPVLFLLFIGLMFLHHQLAAQGTEFFSSPKKEKVTPPKKVSKPKVPPKTQPKPKPKLKPKTPVVKKPEIRKSISDVIFLLDTSGSMDAFLSGKEQSKLQAAQQALRFFAENMKEGTRFQLWSFNARLTQHPNSSKAKGSTEKVVFEPIGKKGSKARRNLMNEVDRLETRGGTNLYQSVLQAIRYFRSSLYQVPKKTDRRKIIVVLADGQDDGFSPIKLQHVLSAGKRNPEVRIRTIGFGITEQDPLHRVLCQMASDPGSCKIARDAQGLQEIITSFSEEN